MTDPRIVSPEEVLFIAVNGYIPDSGYATLSGLGQMVLDLAHTAAVLGEQREAVLGLAVGHESVCNIGSWTGSRCDCRRGDIRRVLGVEP